MGFKTFRTFIVALSLGTMISGTAFASSNAQMFTYQGRFLNSAGTAPLSDIVDLTFSIYDPSATCLLYQETQSNINLTNTAGVISAQVGSATGASKRTSTDPALSMATIYSNGASPVRAGGANCAGGYTPTAGDARLLRVTVTPHSTSLSTTLSPDLTINSVPQAQSAEAIQGLAPSDFIQAASGVAGQGNVNLANLTTLVNGSDASSLHNHDGRYVRAGAGATLANLGSGAYTTGNTFGIGDASPNFNLGFNGSATQTIGVERATLSNASGNTLQIVAGGATSGGTNANGGSLVLSSGTSTGTGGSGISFQTSSAGAAGTADNAASTKMTLTSSGRLGVGTVNPGAQLEVDSSATSTIGAIIKAFTGQIADLFQVQDHTGATIAKIDSTGKVFGNGLDANSQRITNVLDPTSAQDAATRNYVDSAITSATAGVSTFNTRNGAVTLSSADVTGALTYTPLKNGTDTFTGTLTVTGNVAASTTISAGGAIGANTQFQSTATSATQIGEVIKAAAAQSADLLEFQKSDGTVLSKVDSSGMITLHADPTSGSQAATKSYVDAAASAVAGNVAGSTGYISQFTSASVIGNSPMYVSGSSVGIGNTSPGATLDVTGAVKATSYTSGANASTAGIYNMPNSGAVYARNGANNADQYLIGYNSANDGPYIGSNGHNVAIPSALGIGVANPSTALHVQSTAASPQLITLQGSDGSQTIGEYTNAISFGGDSGYFYASGAATIGNSTYTQPVNLRGSGVTISKTLTVQGTGNSSFVGPVGIGTASPLKLLTIDQNPSGNAPDANTAQLDIRGYHGGGTDYAGLRFRMNEHTTGWGADIQAYDDTAFYGGALLFRTGAGSSTTTPTERMRILSSGNVGIGVTAPSAAFQLKAGTATAGTAPFKFTAGTNLTTPEAGAIEFDGTSLYYTDSSNTRRTLASTSGSSSSSLSDSSGLVNSSNSSLGFNFPSTSTATITTSGGTAFSAGNAANTVLQSGGTTSSVIVKGQSSQTADLLDVQNSAGTNALQVAANGSVGIGTTTPLANLEVNSKALFSAGTNSLYQNLEVAGATTSSGLAGIYLATPVGAGAQRAIALKPSQTGGYPNLSFDYIDASPFTGLPDAGTDNGSLMYIQGSNGNVGIGTTTPGDKLSVSGADTNKIGINVQNTNGSTTAIEMEAGGSSSFGIPGWANAGVIEAAAPNGLVIDSINNVGNAAGGPITFQINRLPVATINTSGNVGIGTASPTSTLHLYGPGDLLETIQSSGGGTSAYTKYQNGTTSWSAGLNLGTGVSNYAISGTGNMLFLPSGNVGIGTQTPQQSLSVNGYLNVDQAGNDDGTYGAGPNIYHGITFGSGSGEGIGSNRSGSGNNPSGLTFYTEYSPRVAITQGGAVGIGVVDPSEMLEVNGNVKATAFLYTSDRRLKTDIVPVADPIDKILALNGVNFTWKKSGDRALGFIAQDVEKVIPEVVRTDEKTTLKSVQYANIVALVVEAFKTFYTDVTAHFTTVDRSIASLQQENEALKTKVDAQQKELDLMNARLNNLEKAK